jgi:hypothetical protein
LSSPNTTTSILFCQSRNDGAKDENENRITNTKEVATSHIFFKIGNQCALCTLIQNANKNIEGGSFRTTYLFVIHLSPYSPCTVEKT